jgi:hypothetical protein
MYLEQRLHNKDSKGDARRDSDLKHLTAIICVHNFVFLVFKTLCGALADPVLAQSCALCSRDGWSRKPTETQALN